RPASPPNAAGDNLRADLLAALDDWRAHNSYRGKAYGLGHRFGSVTDASREFAVSDPTRRPLSSIAHELFHMFGLEHASLAGGGGTGGRVGTPWPPDNVGLLNGYALDRRPGSGGRGTFRTGPLYRILGGPGSLQNPLTPVSIATDAMGNLVANG